MEGIWNFNSKPREKNEFKILDISRLTLQDVFTKEIIYIFVISK